MWEHPCGNQLGTHLGGPLFGEKFWRNNPLGSLLGDQPRGNRLLGTPMGGLLRWTTLSEHQSRTPTRDPLVGPTRGDLGEPPSRDHTQGTPSRTRLGGQPSGDQYRWTTLKISRRAPPQRTPFWDPLAGNPCREYHRRHSIGGSPLGDPLRGTPHGISLEGPPSAEPLLRTPSREPLRGKILGEIQ